jgi:hypothetical protein
MWSRTYATISLWRFPASMRQHESGELKLTSVGLRESAGFDFYPLSSHAQTEAQAVNVALQQSLKWVDGKIVSGRADRSNRGA